MPEFEVWLCPVHKSLAASGALKALDNCIACLRAERDELLGSSLREAISPGGDLSVVDWIDDRYENSKRIAKLKVGEDRQGWLEDASYLLRAREALKQLAMASADEHENVPLRMHIALRILGAFNYGTAGFSAVIVGTVADWIKSGMKGPVPWPDSPFFTEWAEQNGYSKIGRYVGFQFQARLAADLSPKTAGTSTQ